MQRRKELEQAISSCKSAIRKTESEITGLSITIDSLLSKINKDSCTLKIACKGELKAASSEKIEQQILLDHYNRILTSLKRILQHHSKKELLIQSQNEI